MANFFKYFFLKVISEHKIYTVTGTKAPFMNNLNLSKNESIFHFHSWFFCGFV